MAAGAWRWCASSWCDGRLLARPEGLLEPEGPGDAAGLPSTPAWSSAAAWPTPRSPAQCDAAGAAAAMKMAPVIAAAVLPGWFCSALAIADGLRCRAPAGSLAAAGCLAAARFDLRCLADLLDTVGLRSGAIAALSGRPQR